MATKKTESKQETPKDVAEQTGPSNDPWAGVREAGDMKDLDRLKVLIYGKTGTGKSHCGARFRRPLIGVCEEQAIPTIRRTNPHALVKHIVTPQDLMDFKTIMRSERVQRECDAVVLDSLNEAQRILRSYFTSRQGERAGREKTSEESWGLTIDATVRLVDEIRSLKIDAMVLCLSSEVVVDGVGISHRLGLFGKKLPHSLGEFFNLVGFQHIAETERGLRHQVLFRSTDAYLSKGMTGIDDIEPPEPIHWRAKALGIEEPPEVTERINEWRGAAEKGAEE